MGYGFPCVDYRNGFSRDFRAKPAVCAGVFDCPTNEGFSRGYEVQLKQSGSRRTETGACSP